MPEKATSAFHRLLKQILNLVDCAIHARGKSRGFVLMETGRSGSRQYPKGEAEDLVSGRN
jgi:hypothetical protein